MNDSPKLWLRYLGGVPVVAFSDHGAGEELTPGALLALIDRPGERLVIDLSAAARITSPVLGKLVTLHRKALAAGSELRVCCREGSIRDVFRITKLDKLIPTFPTLADALRDF